MEVEDNEDENDGNSDGGYGGGEGNAIIGRLITATYYLTKPDCDVEDSGGCLRLFIPLTTLSSFSSSSAHNVVPHPNRIVLFRSNLVEHNVLPSMRRERLVVIVRLYGTIVGRKSNDYDIDRESDADA